MGEVRVKVKLSNAADMALVRRNLMRPDEVRTVDANALVDTGAVTFVLPSLVVERLGLARPFQTCCRICRRQTRRSGCHRTGVYRTDEATHG
jgi:predicted aspartyl protease